MCLTENMHVQLTFIGYKYVKGALDSLNSHSRFSQRTIRSPEHGLKLKKGGRVRQI